MSAILTIGHSTRSIEEFINLLQANGVEQLIDVRSVPRSRRVPQFNREILPDSQNTAWRNASFRGYADYMQTAEFGAAVEKLIELGRTRQVAIMCAEAVPWRCHRSLVGDALTARGMAVEDIVGAGRRHLHKVTPFAKIEGARVWYPGLTD